MVRPVVPPPDGPIGHRRSPFDKICYEETGSVVLVFVFAGLLAGLLLWVAP